MIAKNQIVTASVKWATSAGNFLPFTNLPQRYAGKTVAICIVGEDIDLASPLPDQTKGDLFGVALD
jgi:hypothetical protein